MFSVKRIKFIGRKRKKGQCFSFTGRKCCCQLCCQLCCQCNFFVTGDHFSFSVPVVENVAASFAVLLLPVLLPMPFLFVTGDHFSFSLRTVPVPFLCQVIMSPIACADNGHFGYKTTGTTTMTFEL